MTEKCVPMHMSMKILSYLSDRISDVERTTFLDSNSKSLFWTYYLWRTHQVHPSQPFVSQNACVLVSCLVVRSDGYGLG